MYLHTTLHINLFTALHYMKNQCINLVLFHTNNMNTHIQDNRISFLGTVVRYLGVAGTPLFPAQEDSPTLSIHVPQLWTLPPYTNPVCSSTPNRTLNPGGVMSRSRFGPAPLSRKAAFWACLCMISWTISLSKVRSLPPKSA